MKSKDFDKLIEHRIALIREVLIRKGAEYSHGKPERFHNFYRAAEIQHSTPEKALIGMLSKHLVSIFDMADTILDTRYCDAYIEEKIGDAINYLILLEGILKQRQMPF